MTLASPSRSHVAADAVDRLGDIAEMLFGVEAINDLEGIREVFVGQVPDPSSAIAQHHASRGALKASSACFAHDALREVRRCRVRVAAGGALDRS